MQLTTKSQKFSQVDIHISGLLGTNPLCQLMPHKYTSVYIQSYMPLILKIKHTYPYNNY